MHEKRHGMSVLDHLVVLTSILVMIALILPTVQPARESRRGDDRAANAVYEMPQEMLRFLDQETGISIVRPDHCTLGYPDPSSLKIRGASHEISVCAVWPPTAQERSRCQFVRHGGWPAYELMVITRESTLDYPAESSYVRLVKTDIGWFKIEYLSHSGTTELLDGPRRYLDTVRFPDKPVAKELLSNVDLPVPPEQ
jgi:hypothetical protein